MRYGRKEKCEPQGVLEKNDSEVVIEISTGPKQNEEYWSNIKQKPYSLQLSVKVPKRIIISKQGVRYQLSRHGMILKHVENRKLEIKSIINMARVQVRFCSHFFSRSLCPFPDPRSQF